MAENMLLDNIDFIINGEDVKEQIMSLQFKISSSSSMVATIADMKEAEPVFIVGPPNLNTPQGDDRPEWEKVYIGAPVIHQLGHAPQPLAPAPFFPPEHQAAPQQEQLPQQEQSPQQPQFFHPCMTSKCLCDGICAPKYNPDVTLTTDDEHVVVETYPRARPGMVAADVYAGGRPVETGTNWETDTARTGRPKPVWQGSPQGMSPQQPWPTGGKPVMRYNMTNISMVVGAYVAVLMTLGVIVNASDEEGDVGMTAMGVLIGMLVLGGTVLGAILVS